MSNSYNEKSLPNMRGRKSVKRAKRLSHKRARRKDFLAGDIEVKRAGKSVVLDKDTKQADVGDK